MDAALVAGASGQGDISAAVSVDVTSGSKSPGGDSPPTIGNIILGIQSFDFQVIHGGVVFVIGARFR